MYRLNINYLSVRAGSESREWGGTSHNVQQVIIHGLYNLNNYNDYDVAVLRVCTDLDIVMYISKYVMCL